MKFQLIGKIVRLFLPWETGGFCMLWNTNWTWCVGRCWCSELDNYIRIFHADSLGLYWSPEETLCALCVALNKWYILKMNCPPLHLQPCVHHHFMWTNGCPCQYCPLVVSFAFFLSPNGKVRGSCRSYARLHISHIPFIAQPDLSPRPCSVTVREHLFAGGTHFSFTYCVGMIGGRGRTGCATWSILSNIMATTAHACTHKHSLWLGEGGRRWKGLDESFRVCFRKTPERNTYNTNTSKLLAFCCSIIDYNSIVNIFIY